MVHYYSSFRDPPLQPATPRVRSENGFGVAGFIISVLAIITCGLLSPIGLLVSLFGLFRRPRGFAIAGTVLGLLGTVIVGSVVAMMVLAANETHAVVESQRTHAMTSTAIARAEQALSAEINRKNKLPEGIEGNKIVVKHNDAWGQALRYDRHGDEYLIRSAGADREFETSDDITSDKNRFPSRPPSVNSEAPVLDAPGDSTAAAPAN
jgi:hypothetical protein